MFLNYSIIHVGGILFSLLLLGMEKLYAYLGLEKLWRF